MTLTPEQEWEIIENNQKKIYRSVDNFMARGSASVVNVPYDDFVQEVTIAFLKYIRHCETMEQINHFPWLSANVAMRRLVLEYQPMSAPKHVNGFSSVIHSMPKTVSLDLLSATSCLDIDGMSKCWEDDKDTQMDFDIFMDDQTDNMKRIASMRVYGMKLREIAEQCGVSANAIWKQLGKLEKSYKNYIKEDENG